MKIRTIIYFCLLILLCTTFPHHKEVRFTSYHPHDAYGSGTCTASGLCIDDFTTNDEGMYLYDNNVVIASANKKATNTEDRFILPESYQDHDYYEIINFTIEDKHYQGIILDLCGACYWQEGHQRYDIFVKDAASAKDRIGTIDSPSSFNFILFLFGTITYLGISYFCKAKNLTLKRLMLRLKHEKKYLRKLF